MELKEMHVFDDSYVFNKHEEEIILKCNENKLSNFEIIKTKIVEKYYSDAAEYLEDADTIEEILITAKAFRLGKEYAECLNNSSLNTFEKKVALYGFINELNVVEQLEGGEDPNNLALLIKASTFKDFVLDDYFDATKSFINYPKISKFIKESSS